MHIQKTEVKTISIDTPTQSLYHKDNSPNEILYAVLTFDPNDPKAASRVDPDNKAFYLEKTLNPLLKALQPAVDKGDKRGQIYVLNNGINRAEVCNTFAKSTHTGTEIYTRFVLCTRDLQSIESFDAKTTPTFFDSWNRFIHSRRKSEQYEKALEYIQQGKVHYDIFGVYSLFSKDGVLSDTWTLHLTADMEATYRNTLPAASSI